MKRSLSITAALLLTAILTACSAGAATTKSSVVSTDAATAETSTASAETASAETTAAETTATETQQATIRLGGLKGPTSMGMVKLLEDNESGATENNYEFTMAISADELTPKLLKGELDILAVPVNLGSVLYNNSDGAVQMLAINTLGVIYICEKGGDSIKSIADLKGQTIYSTGKGSTPEFALSYLLAENGLDINTDVTMEWKSEPTETVATIANQEHAVVLLPQPFVTVAQTQLEDLHIALDLTKEWDALGKGSQLITAGLIARTDFVKENPEAVALFLKEYEASTEWINANIDEGAALVEKYDIVKAAVAKKAIPYCNITYIVGDEMKKATEGYLQVLFDTKPESVGGKIPDDNFYYIK